MVNSTIKKQVNPGIHVVTVTRQRVKEVYITVCPQEGEELSDIVDRLNHPLKKQNARIVKFDIFGPLDKFSACMNSLENVYGQIDFPVTWVEGNCCPGGRVAGMQVHAVSGVKPETIFIEDKPAGRVFEDDFAKYCIAGNVLPGTSKIQSPPEEQTRHTFENMEKAIRLAGMDISNAARMWFHNDNILHWYEEFNAARNSFFKERGILTGLIPASTGIGGKNRIHAAVIASAIAIKAKKDNITVQEVLSPVQCPAPEYGSSFSRAVEISMPDHRSVLVSGTASIGADGKTVHIDDAGAQIAFTMGVVESILASRGMSYSDVTRGIVYFKREKDIPAFNKYCENSGKPAMPVVIVCSDICRDNLLFEIEVDAIKLKKENYA
jgi:enamine deaminase RidA (YjgF/YER057c/UK114 family)